MKLPGAKTIYGGLQRSDMKMINVPTVKYVDNLNDYALALHVTVFVPRASRWRCVDEHCLILF